MEDILPLLNINTPYKQRISEINTKIKKPNSKYSLLNLTVDSSTLKYPKSVYSISPLGLQNSKRNGKDGIVLFGYERKKENSSSENNININSETNDESTVKDFLFNDFIFPIEGNEDNNGLYESPNFAIYYNLEDNNYYIKDFNTGVGALMKIKKYAIEGNTLINIGGNYLVVYIEKNRILIKIFNNSILENTQPKDSNCDIKQINLEENSNSYTSIGRSQHCDIIIEDMLLSKVQCCIEYNSKTKKIYLCDGDGKKESTNGTWVFILNPTKITDNFMFKAEHTLFVANLAMK
jgi:hypothetical protein